MAQFVSEHLEVLTFDLYFKWCGWLHIDRKPIPKMSEFRDFQILNYKRALGGQTDRQTDGQTDRAQCIMRPPGRKAA